MFINFWYYHLTHPAFMEIFSPNEFEFSYWCRDVFNWIISSLGGVIGIVILYWVLHIGGDKKAWTQLEEHQYVEK